jgi:small subunit ribosomal protein S13
MLDVFIKWSQQRNKPSYRVLGDMFGVGSSTSVKVLNRFGIQKHLPFGRLDAQVKQSITREIQNLHPIRHPVLNALTEATRTNIKRLKTIRSYKGFRHAMHLPVRGQRSKTNARTQKNHKPRADLLKSSYRRQNTASRKAKSNQGYFGERSEFLKKTVGRSRSRKSMV